MDGEAVRAYRERLHQFLDRVEMFCRTKEIGYHRMTTDTPIEEFVLAQLAGPRGRMSFLSPLALAIFALSLPLVLLYFLKVRRRERTVSSLLLWARRRCATARRRPSSSGCSAIRC